MAEKNEGLFEEKAMQAPLLPSASPNPQGAEWTLWKNKGIESSSETSAKPSLLENLLRLIEAQSPFKISFEDISGISHDIPDLCLSFPYHVHTCGYCHFAKSTADGLSRCSQNKRLVNSLVRRRRRAFTGLCHLGLTDIVAPVIYEDVCVGIFYGGSVFESEKANLTKQRIRRHCQRSGEDEQTYFEALKNIPHVSEQSLALGQAWMVFLVDFMLNIIRQWQPPMERYQKGHSDVFWSNAKELPAIVANAIHYIHKNFSAPLSVSSIAEYLRCHPVYLGQLFKANMNKTLNDYINDVRITRARRLIEMNHLSLGEVAYHVGFQDQSHFGRQFKKRNQMSPGQYQKANNSGCN